MNELIFISLRVIAIDEFINNAKRCIKIANVRADVLGLLDSAKFCSNALEDELERLNHLLKISVRASYEEQLMIWNLNEKYENEIEIIKEETKLKVLKLQRSI